MPKSEQFSVLPLQLQTACGTGVSVAVGGIGVGVAGTGVAVGGVEVAV